jgi:hypothetical protein
MRRSVVVACLVGSLLLPAEAAFGGESEYGGRLEGDPTTFFGFDVDRVNGVRKARHFFIVDFPYACYDGTTDRSGPVGVPGAFRIRNGRFGGTVSSDSPVSEYEIHGRLRRGGRAVGTLEATRETSTSCYTAELDWRVARAV